MYNSGQYIMCCTDMKTQTGIPRVTCAKDFVIELHWCHLWQHISMPVKLGLFLTLGHPQKMSLGERVDTLGRGGELNGQIT